MKVERIYLRCPGCGHSIALDVVQPHKRKMVRDYGRIDWSRATGELAREWGRTTSYVSHMRRRYAPETLRKDKQH